MPLLPYLFASTSLTNTTLPSTPHLANLSTKPSPKFPHTNIEFPDHARDKILSLEIMGVDSGRVLALNPQLRAASIDSIHSIITYLLSKGLQHKDLPRIFGMCPKVLTSNIRKDLAPVFTFLSKDLGVPDSDFRRVVNRCPRLLTSSARDQLKPALIFLRRLGFRDTGALAYDNAILLVCNVEKTLVPKLEYLVGLGVSREDAVLMVLRCSALFTYSVGKNLKPKYEYFGREMGRSLDELKEFPQYFGFSLDRRIRPRNEEVKRRGIFVPLSVMLKSTDEEFRQLMERN